MSQSKSKGHGSTLDSLFEELGELEQVKSLVAKQKRKDSLPLIRRVKETYSWENSNAFDHEGYCAFICPDPRSGRRGRYTVLALDYQTHEVMILGLEVPLKHARLLAKTPLLGYEKCSRVRDDT